MKFILALIIACAVLFAGLAPYSIHAAPRTAFVITNTASEATTDTLTIVAPGYFPAVAVKGYQWLIAVIQTTNANTSSTYRFRGKIKGGLGWFTWDAENDSLVVTGNDTVARWIPCAALGDSFRIQFLSEAGGTAVTPTVQYRFANPIPVKK